MGHTDIVSGNWIDRFVPERVRPYARLMRLDRPVGTWLLLLPCWWGLALAGEFSLSLYLLFAFGALVMRGAGCAINDMWDREFDKRVERTKTRPLACGALDMPRAVLFTTLLLLLGLGVLLQLNGLSVLLGLSSLVLVVLYPLAKRVTWWPQFVLGLTFNWGALLGWTAARGTLETPALALYVAGIFWTLAYDTIYAFQDTDDDARIGIKSSALFLGDKARVWIAVFFAACFCFLGFAGALVHIGTTFYASLLCAGVHALWQLKAWRLREPASSLAVFKSNRFFGLIVLAAFVFGHLAQG